MRALARLPRSLISVATAILLLRALTPEGYMPGSVAGGTLFELCPAGVPAGFLRAWSGDSHHHHHSNDTRDSQATATEQCPIGHMLSVAAAADMPMGAPDTCALPVFAPAAAVLRIVSSAGGYRSRAPPA